MLSSQERIFLYKACHTLTVFNNKTSLKKTSVKGATKINLRIFIADFDQILITCSRYFNKKSLNIPNKHLTPIRRL